MFYRNIYLSSRTRLCSISSLEESHNMWYGRILPSCNTAIANQMSKSYPYLVRSILESLLCSGRKRNLFWISEVLLASEFMDSLCYAEHFYFIGHCGFGMFQPETESTQVRVLSTKALTCREHKNRHHDKLLLRRRRGKSPACLATGRCVLGCPSSLKTDQTTFWLTYV